MGMAAQAPGLGSSATDRWRGIYRKKIQKEIFFIIFILNPVVIEHKGDLDPRGIKTAAQPVIFAKMAV
jgi:hypothetical protein